MFKICAVIFAFTLICFAQQTSVTKQESLTDGEKIVRLSREAVGLEKQKFESVQYEVSLFSGDSVSVIFRVILRS